MNLHEIPQLNNKQAKRVGRGGKRGKTAGRGTKGQKARAGGTPRPAERDMIKKIPKLRGHGINRSRTVNPNKIKTFSLTLNHISNNYNNGEEVSPQSLFNKGIIASKTDSVKLLNTGEINKKLIFKNIKFSAGALMAVNQSGSTVN